MDTGKYIVLKDWVCDDTIIIFPAYITHAEFVDKLGFKPEDVDSAGFVSLGFDARKKLNARIRCHGEAQSLKLRANPERDSRLAQRLFVDPMLDD